MTLQGDGAAGHQKAVRPTDCTTAVASCCRDSEQIQAVSHTGEQIRVLSPRE